MHISEVEQKNWIQANRRGQARGGASRGRQEAHPRPAQRSGGVRAVPALEVPGEQALLPRGGRERHPDARRGLGGRDERAACSRPSSGMSHRGRLNVLANTVGKPSSEIFKEFEGDIDPDTVQGSGDVKYHLGMTGTFTSRSGENLACRARFQPVASRGRRPGRRRYDPREAGPPRCRCRGQHLSVLLHGDAAFAGQGVVAETLNMWDLPGYRVGGTVHIVVNNNIGFTTAPARAAPAPTRPTSPR